MQNRNLQKQLNKRNRNQLIIISKALGHRPPPTTVSKQKHAQQLAIHICTNTKRSWNDIKLKSKQAFHEFLYKMVSRQSNELAQYIKKTIRQINQQNIQIQKFGRSHTMQIYPTNSYTNSNHQTNKKILIKKIPQKKRLCICLVDCQTINPTQTTLRCIICLKNFHRVCFRIKQPEGKVQKKQYTQFFRTFQCPFCFSCKIDPLNQTKKNLFFGYARSNQKQKYHFGQFQLTDIDLIQLSSGKIYENQIRKLQIRSLRVDVGSFKYFYEMTWPDVAQLRINNQFITDFKPLAYNSSLKKRKDQGKIIDSKYLQKINKFSINQNHQFVQKDFRIKSHTHFISIFLINPLNQNQLIKKTRMQTVQQSKFLLKSQFEGQNTQQVSIQKCFIPLNCVYSSCLINLPSRGYFCTHYKCFDLVNFIAVMNQSRKWKCPICNKRANQFQIDYYFKTILQKAKQQIEKRKQQGPKRMIEEDQAQGFQIKQICFQKNGEYHFIIEQQKEANKQINPKLLQQAQYTNNSIGSKSQKAKPLITINLQQDQEQIKNDVIINNNTNQFLNLNNQENQQNKSFYQNDWRKDIWQEIEKDNKDKEQKLSVSLNRDKNQIINNTNQLQLATQIIIQNDDVNFNNQQEQQQVIQPLIFNEQKQSNNIQKNIIMDIQVQNRIDEIQQNPSNQIAQPQNQINLNRKNSNNIYKIQDYLVIQPNKNKQKINKNIVQQQAIIILDSDEQSQQCKQKRLIFKQKLILAQLIKKPKRLQDLYRFQIDDKKSQQHNLKMFQKLVTKLFYGESDSLSDD